MFKTH